MSRKYGTYDLQVWYLRPASTVLTANKYGTFDQQVRSTDLFLISLTLRSHGIGRPFARHRKALRTASAQLLTSQTAEIVDHVVPGLEGVAAEWDGGGHCVGGGTTLYEVVAVEQLTLVGEDGMPPSGHVDILL